MENSHVLRSVPAFLLLVAVVGCQPPVHADQIVSSIQAAHTAIEQAAALIAQLPSADLDGPPFIRFSAVLAADDQLQRISGQKPRSMAIEDMVLLTLMEVNQVCADDLGQMVAEMKDTNDKEAAVRRRVSEAREQLEKARREMAEEFGALESRGRIDASETIDVYLNWQELPLRALAAEEGAVKVTLSCPQARGVVKLVLQDLANSSVVGTATSGQAAAIGKVPNAAVVNFQATKAMALRVSGAISGGQRVPGRLILAYSKQPGKAAGVTDVQLRAIVQATSDRGAAYRQLHDTFEGFAAVQAQTADGVPAASLDTARELFLRMENEGSLLSDLKQLSAIQDDLKGKLEGMNEMSEMTLLRLRMVTDRQTKSSSTLSNIMERIIRTQEALVQNLK